MLIYIELCKCCIFGIRFEKIIELFLTLSPFKILWVNNNPRFTDTSASKPPYSCSRFIFLNAICVQCTRWFCDRRLETTRSPTVGARARSRPAPRTGRPPHSTYTLSSHILYRPPIRSHSNYFIYSLRGSINLYYSFFCSKAYKII